MVFQIPKDKPKPDSGKDIIKDKKEEQKKDKEDGEAREGLLGEEDQKEKIEGFTIHVMPRLEDQKHRKGARSRKIGAIIITIAVILLALLALGVFFYFKPAIPKQGAQTDSFLELDEELKIPEKIKPPAPKKPTPKPIKKEPEKPQAKDSDIVEAEKTEAEPVEIIKIEQEQGAATSAEIIKIEEAIATTTEAAAITTIETVDIIDLSIFVDTDSDGLSNQEEILIGLKEDSNDTDGDSYNDLEELLTLNNPLGAGGIIDNAKIQKYSNKAFSYSLFYPASWSVTVLSESNSVMFRTADNQTIQVIAPLNTKNSTIEEWYKIEVSAKPIREEQRLNKDGWEGIRSEDGYNIYMIHPNSQRVFVLFYNDNDTLFYKNIFQMMINSFTLE